MKMKKFSREIFQECTDGRETDLLIGKYQRGTHHQNMICRVDQLMDILIRMFLLAKIYFTMRNG